MQGCLGVVACPESQRTERNWPRGFWAQGRTVVNSGQAMAKIWLWPLVTAWLPRIIGCHWALNFQDTCAQMHLTAPNLDFLLSFA